MVLVKGFLLTGRNGIRAWEVRPFPRALPAGSSGCFSGRTAHSCALLSQGTGGLIDGALESGVGMASKRSPIPSRGVLKRRESLLVPVLPL